LKKASKEGQCDVIKLLIKNGAIVKAKSVDGDTALHLGKIIDQIFIPLINFNSVKLLKIKNLMRLNYCLKIKQM